ncbi:hypothetical protein [Metabacillus endolithicus]|uniref:hypothetical protein n=1 Tax=Metabacillus endolithicus TaxID=1535204 RepID=UPI001FF9D219|nr:hypothetical protein [Metabacillus endolithicus]UPG61677.1 hypothetical protein MVE64_13270 [Metabacillus endolithicus]
MTRHVISIISCLFLFLSGSYNIIVHGFTFPFLILTFGGLIGFIGSLFYKVRKKKLNNLMD